MAFARAGDAVASAVSAQRALHNYPWPDGVRVRVRMGLLSGEPRTTGERYVGFGVHRAARVGAVGHGGQILLSNATRELVEDELPPETRLRDLGSYELKDLDRPEHLFQLEADGLPHEFPRLRARRVARPHRLRRLLLVAAAAVGVAAAAAASAVYWSESRQPAVGSAQRPITILSPWEGSEEDAFVRVLKAFEKETGLKTQHDAPGPNFLPAIRSRVAGNPPMLAMIPSPGLLADYAREALLKPLAELGISDSDLRQNYSDAWIDLGTVDGTAYGLPVKANSKSVFWYRPDDLEAMGLSVPKTWTELLGVTEEITAAGGTPWALGAEDSWTLTDWFENIYIRTAGPRLYSRLFAGKLGFDHSSVTLALTQMTRILNDRYVVGGIPRALETSFFAGIRLVFGEDPRAHLYMEGGFVGGLALREINSKLKPGRTIDVAPFPTIDPSLGSPLLGGGNLTAVFVDNAAVRELVRYLSSPAAARVWVSTGQVVSPNKRVPLSAYPNDLVRAEAKQVVGANVVRFDGSDLLPGSLAEAWGATLQQIIQKPGEITELMKNFQRKSAREFKRSG